MELYQLLILIIIAGVLATYAIMSAVYGWGGHKVPPKPEGNSTKGDVDGVIDEMLADISKRKPAAPKKQKKGRKNGKKSRGKR